MAKVTPLLHELMLELLRCSWLPVISMSPQTVSFRPLIVRLLKHVTCPAPPIVWPLPSKDPLGHPDVTGGCFVRYAQPRIVGHGSLATGPGAGVASVKC